MNNAKNSNKKSEIESVHKTQETVNATIYRICKKKINNYNNKTPN